jgi:sulfate permease, SulP family
LSPPLSRFAEILDDIDKLPPIVILRLRNTTAIDATGLGAIRDLADTLHDSGRTLLLCGAREQPSQLLRQAEFERHIPAENICASINDALSRAARINADRGAPSSREAAQEFAEKGALAT